MNEIKIGLLVALLLTGCGGGSSTPTAIETVKEVFVHGDTVTVTEPGETETVYVVQECPVCPDPVVVEPEPKIVTYYQIATTTHDGDNIEDKVYNEEGYIVSDYNERDNLLSKYAYDENNNQISYTIERDGLVLSYTYSTYDDNNNLIATESYSVREWGDGIVHIVLYTYEGDNQVKIENTTIDRVENMGYDINDNLIYKDIVINGETVQVETYTWQEFTEEIK